MNHPNPRPTESYESAYARAGWTRAAEYKSAQCADDATIMVRRLAECYPGDSFAVVPKVGGGFVVFRGAKRAEGGAA